MDTHAIINVRAGNTQKGMHRVLHKCISRNASELCTATSPRQKGCEMKQLCHSHLGRLCYFTDMMQSPCEEHKFALHATFNLTFFISYL